MNYSYSWWDSDGSGSPEWDKDGWDHSTVTIRQEKYAWQLLIDLPDVVVGYETEDERLLVMWRVAQ